MPTPVVIGATSYNVYSIGERSWGSDTSALLIRLASIANQVATNTYTLTANYFLRDTSGNFGVKANFVQGIGATASADGFLRLASPYAEPGQGLSYPVGTPEGKSYTYISWRNTTNNGNIHLFPNNDNTTLSFAGKSQVNTDAAQTLQNKTLDNTNVITGAAITDGTITNAKIAAAAAIALSKLATVTASRALVSDVSGFISASSVTATELGLLSGVTGTLVGTTTSQTLTNKTIVAANNTITTTASGNLAATELNTALTELQTDIDTRATASALSAHEADTSTHGVATVAGLTEPQTFTNKTLTDSIIDDGLRLNHETSVTTPAAGKVAVFAKADNKIYKVDSSGTETQLATTAEALSNPMTTAGDVIIAASGGAAVRSPTPLLGDITASASNAVATMTVATPCVVTVTSHGLALGEKIYFTTTGALPTGLSVNTAYYAIPINANTFNLASSGANAFAGTKIATSGTQSGTHTMFYGGLQINPATRRPLATGSFPGAGNVGEKLTFTSRAVSAVTSGYTANASALTTLTPGVWLICSRVSSNGGASLSGWAAFIGTGTANANSEHIDSSVDTVFVDEEDFGAGVAVPSIYYATSASQAIYIKAQSFGATTTITCTGFAVRIA